MINKFLNDSEMSVCIVSKKNYDRLIKDRKIQIKGKSDYDDCIIVEDLPRNKEFYVLDEYKSEYENGYEEWGLQIATIYKGMYFIISADGSN